jgi:hypothetical protein
MARRDRKEPRSAGTRLLISVHLPSGTALACTRLGVWRQAARDARSAILTPSTACGSADGDRWKPHAIARLDERLLDVAQLVDLALQCGTARRTLSDGDGIVRHAFDLGRGGVRALLREQYGKHRQPPGQELPTGTDAPYNGCAQGRDALVDGPPEIGAGDPASAPHSSRGVHEISASERNGVR